MVQDRDLSQGIIDLVEKVYGATLEGWENKLRAYLVTEEARIRRRNKDERDAERLIANRHDLVDCLAFFTHDAIYRGVTTATALRDRITGFFRTSTAPIHLSTVHKAKGKEANRVFILYPDLMPAIYARSPEALKGEACVQFVAITRSKRDLIFVYESPDAEYDEWE